MLALLDKAFFVFHALLIAFNMVGWAWRRTRTLHLIVLGLTAFSWTVMGASLWLGLLPVYRLAFPCPPSSGLRRPGVVLHPKGW